MELPVNGGEAIKVSERVFGRDFSEPLVHQVVTAYLAGGRAGTKAQKTRAQTRGGGRKPWRQKGTGNARAGTIRSPLWRGGGKTFAAVPRSHGQKVNRKMYRGAMQAVLSELVRQERLLVVDALAIQAPRTRDAKSWLGSLGVESGLLVDVEPSREAQLATRNLPHVKTVKLHEINPVDLVAADHVVMTVEAVNSVEEWLK